MDENTRKLMLTIALSLINKIEMMDENYDIEKATVEENELFRTTQTTIRTGKDKRDSLLISLCERK